MIPALPVEVPVAHVPYYSQFTDVSAVEWKKNACGVVSIAMVVDYYSTKEISVDTMLSQALKSGAYLQSAGWTHKGLIDLATKYGMKGQAYDMTRSSQSAAFSAFTTQLKTGPVIASVHYKFEPTNPIPHLVVIVGMDKTHVYYNDPATAGAGKKLSIADFKKAWKQKFIVIRPVAATAKGADTEKSVVVARVSDSDYFASFFTRIVPGLFSRGTIG